VTGTTSKPAPLGAGFRALFTATTISNLGDGMGAVAYPWLASAVTRNPMLIALVPLVQRLPWLAFTLPAGVLTDRLDRKLTIVLMDTLRAIVTAGVALSILVGGNSLPKPKAIATSVHGTRVSIYLVLLLATVLLGTAEVLRDNTAQTFLPSIIADDGLERANGRLASTEQVANTFIGPPLGSALLAMSFFIPFAIDAVSFAAAAGLIATIGGTFRPVKAAAESGVPSRFRDELREGFAWLWAHSLLRPMAIILGLMNAIGFLTEATYILFTQEVLHATPLIFAALATGYAVGGIVGSLAGPAIRKRIGIGPSLWLCLGIGVLTFTVTGLSSSWILPWVMGFVFSTVGSLWNVITVSLRQSLIPDALLGRVNSVYRFFAWGMMPIGALIGGLIVSQATRRTSRESALRLPYFVAAVASALLFAFGARKLTTEKITAARAEAGLPPLT
jgi:MFS family permease